MASRYSGIEWEYFYRWSAVLFDIIAALHIVCVRRATGQTAMARGGEGVALFYDHVT